MALQPIQLDTLNWDQMVTAIRTRIVPNSQGKWTLHAPVDPGVTMLELFAWLLDQRIYWMNQVPASLRLAILGLLGESPKPAQAAVTVLQVSDSANPPRQFPAAAKGTLMQLGDSNPPLIFTLNDGLTVLPLKGIGLRVDGTDRSNDLAQCRPVSLLAAGKNSAQVEILLSLSTKLPDSVAGTIFSLMIDLEGPESVFAEWTAEAVADVPVPATLAWSYTSNKNGAAALFPAAQIHDGTAGLRRSGVVRLPLPADWQPEAAGAAGNVTVYKVILQIQGATFTNPPQLRRLKANVVLARHVWSRTRQPVTRQWLPLPGNVVSLPAAPTDSSMPEYPPIENTVQVQVKEPDGVARPWQLVSDFSLSGPADRVFAVNRVSSEIRFGDGLTGRLPVTTPTDASDITVSYQAGGGTAGNVGEGLSWEAVPESDSAPFPQFSAVNLAPGDGGAETETLDAATARSTAALNERNRAVSKTDYENLARTTPGVALRRAYAAVGYHRDFPCSTVPGAITVFVVPYAPRVQTDGDWASGIYVAAPVPDQGALQAVQARLAAAKLIGGEVFVCPAAYRPVWLTLHIAVDSQLSASLRQQIIAGFATFLDPLTGGDGGEGWPFGDPLRPSALLRVAQGILGRAGDVQSVAVSIDRATAAAKPCTDVPIRPFELVHLMHVDLITQRRSVPGGGLR
jgi:hypothetical protein